MERLLRFNIVGTLTISAILQNGSKRITRNVVIENVYYVPTLSATLLSVSRLVHSGHVVRFMHNEWSITKGKEHNELLRAVATNGVYEVTTSETPEVRREIGSAMVAALRASVSLETWHRRLDHLNIPDCRRLAASKAVRGVVISQITEPHVCRTCALAKVTTASAPAVRSSSDSVADIVCHLDLSGPVKRSYHGNEYFIVIVWRGYVRVYGLRSENNASDKAVEFLRFIECQAQVSATSIKTMRTDGRTEFLGEDFRKLVTDDGLHHQHTTRYRSSQNGVAEISIRTLTEMAAAMLIDSHLPHYLWEDALRHAAYIRNRVPKRGSTVTPHERIFGTKPSLAGMPIFGQTVVVRTPEPVRRKRYRFDGRGNIGGFVGFSDEIRGYRVYVPGHGRPIKETTDVILLDTMLVEEIVLEGDIEPSSEEGEDTDNAGHGEMTHRPQS
jgi:hypothetical protein